MLRDGRIVFFPLAILALFLASYFFFQSAYQPDTKPVPETELNQPPVLPPPPNRCGLCGSRSRTRSPPITPRTPRSQLLLPPGDTSWVPEQSIPATR